MPGLLKLTLCCAALMGFHTAAYGQQFSSDSQQTTLIELYTSEGCSSCPPADEWLSELKSDSDLWKDFVPVAFHVDYWDWIGWKDEFAKPAYGERQKSYKSHGNARSVYTPGFFANGQEWREFFQQRSKTRPPKTSEKTGRLRAEIVGDRLTLRFTPSEAFLSDHHEAPLKGHIALLEFEQSNLVKWGENIGKRLHHDFVVTHLISLTMKPDKGTNQGYSATMMPGNDMKAWLAKPGKKAIAFWISDSNTLEVFQSTGGWLNADSTQPD